jgi:hypothetical protein
VNRWAPSDSFLEFCLAQLCRPLFGTPKKHGKIQNRFLGYLQSQKCSLVTTHRIRVPAVRDAAASRSGAFTAFAGTNSLVRDCTAQPF